MSGRALLVSSGRRDVWAAVRLSLRQTRLADALVYRYGPAAQRVPSRLRRRALQQDRIPRLPGVTTWTVGQVEHVVPPPPDAIEGTDAMAPLALRPRSLSAPFVAEVPDATLVGVHAVPFASNGRMLLTGFIDALAHVSAEPHPELVSWCRGQDLEPVDADLADSLRRRPVCSLVGRFDSNYFHWIIDICGQLQSVRYYAEATGSDPALLVRHTGSRFIRESLTLLGFGPEEIISWPLDWLPGHEPGTADRIAAAVPRLVVPSWRGSRHVCSPQSLAWLRGNFLAAALDQPPISKVAAGRPRRVHVARSPTGWRSLFNDDEVEKLLADRGFVTIRPEEHTLADQIRIFAGSEIIVGMHGAGLANVLFAPHAHLVELVGAYGTSAYFRMCSALGNRYTRVGGLDRGDDLVVDAKALGELLRRNGVVA
jgi:capsular polysaccharide biosynthesis protein